MAKINPCFKKIFIFFNAIFAILGVVIFSLALIAHQYADQIHNMSGIIVLYAVGSAMFIFSGLGVYAAYKESKVALIVFFVLMSVVTVILLRGAFPVAMSRHEIISDIRNEFKQVSLTAEMENTLDTIQSHFHCCGLTKGYQDWKDKVPVSCNCYSEADEKDVCERITPRSLYQIVQSEDRYVWSKPCGDIFIYYLEKGLSIGLGLMFGLAALAILGGLMSLAMIVRVSAPDHLEVPTIPLSYAPPKYSELVNY